MNSNENQIALNLTETQANGLIQMIDAAVRSLGLQGVPTAYELVSIIQLGIQKSKSEKVE